MAQPTTSYQKVLVAGATGGVGQLVVANLLQQNIPTRVLARNVDKVKRLFEDRVEMATGDIRQPETLAAATDQIDAIICCTGTTAFPSARWDFDIADRSNPLEQFTYWSQVYLDSNFRQQHSQNNPAAVDGTGVSNLVAAAPADLKQFIFVSSCGVERKQTFPFNLLNAFGVLEAKEKGEVAIRQSGLTYTIIRPARLIDGPFTSYDLNTLFKASTEGTQGVVVGTGDQLNGQTSRIDVAAACVASLTEPGAKNKVFELINQGPRPQQIDWTQLLSEMR